MEKYQITSDSSLAIAVLLYAISVSFFIRAVSRYNRGRCLTKGDLLPGEEYVLIKNVLLTEEKKNFSTISSPGSNTVDTFERNHDLNKLSPGDHFVIMANGEIRELTKKEEERGGERK